MSRVKVVATIGPKTANAESIQRLIAAGMDVARLNGAHADLPWHSNAIDLIRSVDSNIPILLDLPGSKVRTGDLDPEPTFDVGDRVVFTTAQRSADGKIPLSNQNLHEESFPWRQDSC